jgi:hypothetical protein
MRKLFLILLAVIAMATFIRAFDNTENIHDHGIGYFQRGDQP